MEHVVLHACPGGGKTFHLKNVCDDSSLFLAYNAQLAVKMSSQMEHGTCMTFHAFCSRYLYPVRDDYQMKKTVDRVKRGELTLRSRPPFRKILIDEAQDVRLLYMELLDVMGLLQDDMTFYIAGDANQLVYDFDSDFPASLALLQTPWEVLHTAKEMWELKTLSESRRLTMPMCEFVNHMFGTSIRSSKEGIAVSVFAPKTTGEATNMVVQILETLSKDTRVLLLVDRKRGNRNLRHLLNTLSVKRLNVNVHGIDAPDLESRIVCGSFWSCKGLEEDVVITFLPGMAARNPTYVALTRAREQLFVVLDPKEPHAAACHAALELNVLISGSAKVVQSGLRLSAMDSLQRRSISSGAFRNMDYIEFSSSVLERACTCTILEQGLTEEEETFVVSVSGRSKDASTVLPAIALAKAESRTGTIRIVNDILNPTRLDFTKYQNAIGAGLVSRWIPRFVSNESLLADDLRSKCLKAYETRPWTEESIALMALAGIAWDDFDHQMRAFLPVNWMDEERIRLSLAFLMDQIPVEALYDVRLSINNRHVRYHALTTSHSYHVVWNASSTDMSHACSRALMHPSCKCRLVELCFFRVTEVHVTDRELLMANMH